MFIVKNIIHVLIIGVCLISGYCYASTNNPEEYDYQSAGLRTVIRVYDECSKIDGNFVPCLKKKTITFLDRIEQIDSIYIGEGVKLIRLPNPSVSSTLLHSNSVLSDMELESQLPRGHENQDLILTNMLIERISRFFNGHTLQMNFPQISVDELGRGLSEGRGKMKKMMGMMMMGMAMKMMGMIPVAMAGLYMMAGKALIVSKIALLLAGIMVLKKLMSGKGGGGGSGGSGWSSGGGGGGGWSSGGGGGGGGWDRRSLDQAQNLAYRGYNNPTNKSTGSSQETKSHT